MVAAVAACTTRPPASDASSERAREQVRAAEAAFARSMAERDPAAFARFVSAEAVFFSGDTPLRGKAAVLEAWAAYFTGPQAPFSWEPRDVEVLPSGDLALSSGPVRGAGGELIGNFNSVWRREAPGTWRVVFDKGSAVCRCADR